MSGLIRLMALVDKAAHLPELVQATWGFLGAARDAIRVAQYAVGPVRFLEDSVTIDTNATEQIQFAFPFDALIRNWKLNLVNVTASQAENFDQVQLLAIETGAIKYYDSLGGNPNFPWVTPGNTGSGNQAATAYSPGPSGRDGFARWIPVDLGNNWTMEFRNFSTTDRYNVSVELECYTPLDLKD